MWKTVKLSQKMWNFNMLKCEKLESTVKNNKMSRMWNCNMAKYL